MDLPWLDGINHRVSKRRIPSVLTRDKVAGVLAQGAGGLRDASAGQHTETRLPVKSRFIAPFQIKHAVARVVYQ